MHSTNYIDTFIVIAPDSKATKGIEPSERAAAARSMFEMIHGHPYRYTSDDVIFAAHVHSKGADAFSREEFFSKGQACLRSSSLPKTFGWGIHFDSQGRIAIYGVESKEYRQFAKKLPVKAAMRSRRPVAGD
jgi:Family of unknown function (DUF6157)